MTIQNILGLKIIDKKSCMFPSYNKSATLTWVSGVVAVNMDDYPVGAKGVFVVCGANDYSHGNDTPSCIVEMYDSSDVLKGSVTLTAQAWPLFDIKSSTTPFELNSGLDYYYFKRNAYWAVVSKVELYIVLEW